MSSPRNNGQRPAIVCTEVSEMAQADGIHRELQSKVALALERQINEQLYRQGAITKQMYEAAKQSLERAAGKTKGAV